MRPITGLWSAYQDLRAAENVTLQKRISQQWKSKSSNREEFRKNLYVNTLTRLQLYYCSVYFLYKFVLILLDISRLSTESMGALYGTNAYISVVVNPETVDF